VTEEKHEGKEEECLREGRERRNTTRERPEQKQEGRERSASRQEKEEVYEKDERRDERARRSAFGRTRGGSRNATKAI